MSSIEAGKVVVPVEPEAKDFGRQLGKQIESQQSQFNKNVGRFGLALGAVVAAGIGIAIKKSVDLQETFTAVTFAFGTAADRILDMSKRTDDAFSQIEFNRAAKGFATFGKAAKLSDEETADFSLTLIAAAQDLASFHDANTSDALQDMQSALTGLYRPLRKYAIVLSDVGLTTFAVNKGIIEQGEKLTDQEKILVRQQYILENMGAATGDWARTMGNAANQERMAKANATDLAAQLGNSLLPAYTKVLGVAVKLVAILGKHTDAVYALVIAAAALSAGMIVWAAAMKVAAAATVIMAIATKSLTKATKANIFGAIAVGVLYLVTALIVAYQTSEKFRRIMKYGFEIVTKALAVLVKSIAVMAYVFGGAMIVILRGMGLIPKFGKRFDQAAESIQNGIDKLNDFSTALWNVEGPMGKIETGVKNVGNAAADAIVDTDKWTTSLKKLQERLTEMSQSSTDVTSAFSTKILQAFDAETTRVLDNLQVRVQALGESWLMRPGDMTPAERELEALDKAEAKRDLALRKSAAQKDLKEAKSAPDVEQEIGGKIITISKGADKEAVKAAQEELADIEKDVHRNKLVERAAKEREAAEKAFTAARKEYQALRDLQKEHFEKELTALNRSVERGLLSQKAYRNKVLALMAAYGVSLEQAGNDLGKAFSTGLMEAMVAVEEQARRTNKILTRMVNLRNKITKTLALAMQQSGGDGTDSHKGGRGGYRVVVMPPSPSQTYDEGGKGRFSTVGQYVENQYVLDEATARQIGNNAARKVVRR